MMRFEVTAEIEASEFLADENGAETANWEWCTKNATFSHKEACEFILHCGDERRDEREDGEDGFTYAEHFAERMRAGGCSEPFIAAYLEAARAGAIRVLFYV